jgi:hypothetical protein
VRPAADITPTPSSDTALNAAAAVRRELILIDADLPDRAELARELRAARFAGTAVAVVELTGGGVAEVTAVLARYRDLDAVHLLSHGEPGALHLGADRIAPASLAAFAADFRAWGAALAPGADLLLYGCDLAGAGGAALASGIAALTGADVAASTDRTGAAAQGGDWELEYRTGAVEARTAAAPAWGGVLAAVTVTTTADVVNGNTSSIAALIASNGGDGISLREAILAANNTAGADQINLSAGTYVLTAGQMEITGDLTLTGAGPALTAIDGNNADRVFRTRGTSLVNLTGVTIRGGSASDNGGAIYVDDSSVLTVTDSALTNNNGGKRAGRRDPRSRHPEPQPRPADQQPGRRGRRDLLPRGRRRDADQRHAQRQHRQQQGRRDLDRHVLHPAVLRRHLNTAGTGGGVFSNGSTVNISSTIVAGNTATTASPDVAGSFSSDKSNLIGAVGTASGFSDDLTGVSAGLGPLADNGGPTRTHALLPGSLAIGRGAAAGAPATDQRGSPRDASPDIGAFELATKPAPVLDAGKSPVLNAQGEDSGPPAGAVGTPVASLVDFAAPAGQVDNVSDPDAGAALGIAVTAADATNGAGGTRPTAGRTGSSSGGVERLRPAAGGRRRHAPLLRAERDFHGTLATAITFRAWDRTAGTNGASPTPRPTAGRRRSRSRPTPRR